MKKIIATLSVTFGLALGACASAEIEEVASPAASSTTESATTTMEAESEPIPSGGAPTLDELDELTYVETVLDGLDIYKRPLSNDHYLCIMYGEAPAYDWFITETGCSEAMSLDEIYSAIKESIEKSIEKSLQ